MAIEFSCPYCQQLVRTPYTAAGKKGKCPQCQAVVQIPAVAAAKADPAPAGNTGHRQTTAPLSGPSDAASAGIEFFCVECGQLVRTPAAAAGKKGKCPNCQSLIDIPHRAAGSKSSTIASPQAFRRSTTDLTPLEELQPIKVQPQPPAPPPDLAPLLDEVMPPLAPLSDEEIPSLPASGWRGGGLPFAGTASKPRSRRFFSDLDRRGLPWERDPSLETFFETVRYVLSAPGDAFLTMQRHGIGSPVGFFMLSAVVGSLLAFIMYSICGFCFFIVYYMMFNTGQSIIVRWDTLALVLGAMAMSLILVSLVSGTIGGLVNAVVWHVSLLVCGAANAGFSTTYRVTAFGLGSLQVLAAIPLIGPLLATVLLPIVLTYGFMNAHETSGGRAFFSAILPLLVGLCCAAGVAILFATTLIAGFHSALQHVPQS